ncbi:hypothetical protein WJX72_006263 [[Myrmecia] bisecta]|uniref:Uncharacterized protein n=1 Tax=[Myrmecia] bisecta TaxID=41462 RepID=A0AAW1PY06_9CHLO
MQVVFCSYTHQMRGRNTSRPHKYTYKQYNGSSYGYTVQEL